MSWMFMIQSLSFFLYHEFLSVSFWIATLLWNEMKVCASIELHLAYHVDPTSLAGGEYKLIMDQAVEIPTDPGTRTKLFWRP
jgi:hypothetical protein